MKKIIALLLAGAMVVAMAACGTPAAPAAETGAAGDESAPAAEAGGYQAESLVVAADDDSFSTEP